MAFDWQPGKNYQITITDALGTDHTLQIANPKTTGDPACQFLGSDGFVELPGGLYDPNMPPTTGYTPPLRGLFTVQWKDIPRQCWPVAPPLPDPDDFALRYDWPNITNDDVLAQFEAGRIHRMEDVTTSYTNLHQVLKEVIQADYAAGNKYTVGRNYTFRFTVKDTSQRFSIRITGLTILRGTPLYTQYCEQDGIIDNYKPEFWQHDSAYFQIVFNWGSHRVALNQYGVTKPDLSETTSLDGLGYECNPEGIQYGFFMWPSGKVCAFHNTKFSTEKDIGLNTFITNADHNFPTIQAGYGVDAGLLNITEGGGGGNPLGLPDLSNYLGVSDTGMVNMYGMTPSQMQSFGSYLWAQDFFAKLRDFFTNPEDGVVMMGILPLATSEVIKPNALTTVKLANLDTGIATSYAKDIVVKECGSLTVSQTFFNFLDYQKELTIYLPYVGYKPVDVSRYMGGTISVTYYIDVFTGSGICFLLDNSGEVIQQYPCDMGRRVPITANNYGDTIRNLLTALASTTGGVMAGIGGNPAGAAQGFGAAAGSAINMVGASLYGSVRQLNGVSSAPAQAAQQFPILVYNAPIQAYTGEYAPYIGEPVAQVQALSTLDGFAIVRDAQIGITGTQEDLDEIRGLLESGVIF